MTISIDAEKAFVKIQHSFMIKTQQNETRGNIPKYNKGHIWQTYCQYHTQWAKTKNVFLKIRIKTGVSAFTTLIQYSSGSPSYSNQTIRRNKIYPNWKRRSKSVIIHKQHDSVHRKPCKLHQKTTQPNKWIWQNGGPKSQYSEIDGIFVH